MGVNKAVYNLCAGMIENDESMEDCIARELYEETGLKLKRILKVLPATFAAVALSDIKNQMVFTEVEGIIHPRMNRLKPLFIPKKKLHGCWKMRNSARGHNQWHISSQ